MASCYTMVTEETLRELTCHNCLNYLSHGKVQVAAKLVICGRCSYQQRVPAVSESITKYLFPCINRFDGCNELLLHHQVDKHERGCISNTYLCPQCKYRGNGTQFYGHWLKQHPHMVLQYPIFRIHLLDVKYGYYIYRHNNKLIVISYQLKGDGVLSVNTVNYTGNNERPIKYRYVFTSLKDVKECYKTGLQNCTISQSLSHSQNPTHINVFRLIKDSKYNVLMCTLEVINSDTDLFVLRNPNDLERRKSFETNDTRTPEKNKVAAVNAENCARDTQEQLTLSELNKKKLLLDNIMNGLRTNWFPKLVCCNCGGIVIAPIFSCPSNHVKCKSCDTSFCSSCDDIQNWSRAEHLEEFHNITPLPCRWDNCGQLALAKTLRSHEKTCPLRRHQCPVEWCSWSGTMDDLFRKHWHSPLNIYETNHTFHGFLEDIVEFYLTFDDELFYCRVDPLTDKGRTCHFRQTGHLGADEYVGKFFISHYCDGKMDQRQSDLRIGGIIPVARHCFEFFGVCKNYKCLFAITKKLD